MQQNSLQLQLCVFPDQGQTASRSICGRNDIKFLAQHLWKWDIFREKILYYLLINQVSLRAVSKVCEATIVGLSRIINQGNRDKNIEVLNNPRIVLDEEVFLNYLFADNWYVYSLFCSLFTIICKNHI